MELGSISTVWRLRFHAVFRIRIRIRIRQRKERKETRKQNFGNPQLSLLTKRFKSYLYLKFIWIYARFTVFHAILGLDPSPQPWLFNVPVHTFICGICMKISNLPNKVLQTLQ
jgi:hypothetical protein